MEMRTYLGDVLINNTVVDLALGDIKRGERG